MEFGEVQNFVKLRELGKWAWIRVINDISVDMNKGIASFKLMGGLQWIEVKWIVSLIGVVQDCGVDLMVIDVNLFE